MKRNLKELIESARSHSEKARLIRKHIIEETILTLAKLK